MTTFMEPTTTSGADWAGIAEAIGTQLRPSAAHHDYHGTINVDAFAELRASGLTAALVPAEFGGGGASHAEVGHCLRTLGRHDPATAVTLSMHSHLVALQVWRHLHGMDAEKILRRVAGDRILLVSTGASDWVASNGTVVPVEGGYRVSARKGPASGCEVGDVVVTSVRWQDAPDGPKVIHCSIPTSAPGVSIDPTWDTLGLRATGSHTVVFEDVFVPEAAVSLVRPADEWPKVLNAVMGCALPLIMSAYVGIADEAASIAVAAAAGRTEPHTLHLLGELTNAHLTAQDMVAAMFDAADGLRFANTDENGSRALARKSVVVGAVTETVRLAVEIAGGSGYGRASSLERLWRDVQGAQFHPLPRAKQAVFSGRVAAGLSPVA